MNKRRKRPKQRQLSFAQAMAKGAKLLQTGRAQQALPLLHHAYGLEPDDVEAAINLGGAYVMLNRPQQAIPVLEEAVEQAPENSKVWINLAAAYLGNPILANAEKQERAIKAFEKALELDPAAPSVDYNLGLIYRDQGNRTAATAHLKRAAAINPLDLDARRLLEKLQASPSKQSDQEKSLPGGPHGS